MKAIFRVNRNGGNPVFGINTASDSAPPPTTLLPNRARTIALPARRRLIKVSKDMIVRFDSKRPHEQPIYSLNIAKELAIVPGDAIVSVITVVRLKSGAADSNMAAMVDGSASYDGTIISQRIKSGISGNVYYIVFIVATQRQPRLEFVAELKVTDEGVTLE